MGISVLVFCNALPLQRRVQTADCFATLSRRLRMFMIDTCRVAFLPACVFPPAARAFCAVSWLLGACQPSWWGKAAETRREAALREQISTRRILFKYLKKFDYLI
jgi:hypothetical protein